MVRAVRDNRADDGPASALRYLVAAGILSTADSLAADPSAEEVSMSHRAYRVSLGNRPRWFVKAADPVRSLGRDLGAEAAVYRLAAAHPALARVTPRCWMIAAHDQTIVLDAVDGEPLTTAIWQRARAHDERRAILTVYGEALAHIHSVRPPRLGQPPWLLNALEPRWGRYEWLPAPCGALLIRLARSRAFREGFRIARREWRTTALVHGDIRWANGLVARCNGGYRIWIVDWELGCTGDPAWDVGSALADIVAASTMYADGSIIDDPPAWATTLLAGYRSVAQPNAGEWTHLLARSVRLAGVRLVQTVLEHGHVSPGDVDAAAASVLPWAHRFLVAPALTASAFSRDLQ